jgi:hypothetical protein
MIILLNNKRKLCLVLLILLFPIIFFGYNVFFNSRFLIAPAKEIEGRIININRSRFITTLSYSYQLADKVYQAKATKDLVPLFHSERNINVRYLIEDEKISTIGSFVLNNLILNFLGLLFFLLLFLLLWLGLLHLLPSKNQLHFDSFLKQKQ